MAEIRVNSTGGVKLFDADDSHYAQIKAGTVTSNTDVLELGSSAVVAGTKVDLNGQELILDADADTSITADTDDQIDVRIAGADDFQFTANTFTAQSGSSIVVPDGGLTFGSTAISSTAAELNILDGVTSTTAELNILDGVTSTAAELNIVDGNTSATSTTIADADRVVLNDNGTMVQAAVTDLKTYIGGGTLVKTAAVDFESGTGAAGVELQNCFNTTYDSYYFVIRRYLPENDGDDVRFRPMTGTNTQVDSSIFNYAARYFNEDGTAGSSTGASQSFFRIGNAVTNVQEGGGFSATLFITIDRTDSSGNAFRFSGSGGFNDHNEKNNSIHMSGVLQDTTADVAVTGIRIFCGGDIRKVHMTCYGITE